jgi:Arm DNA-binding domain
MARLTYRLTAVGVTNETEEGLHPDGDGLYLRITQTGTKLWMFRFKRHGVTRDMGLGPVAEISLAKARELAGSARRQLLDGIDPIKARKAQQATAKLAEARGITFKTCAEQFIGAHEVTWRNPKHRQQWHNTLKSYVYPVFGDLSVTTVDTGLVMKVLEPIWPKKPETASRIRGRIETVLDWARARGYREGENAAVARTPRPSSAAAHEGQTHPSSPRAAVR